MKKTYTLLLLLTIALLGIVTQTKAQTPLMEPSIDLTFITDDENASLLIGVIAPTDGCWIDLNGDGQCQDNEKIEKGTDKKAINLPKDLTKTTIYGPITYLNLNKTALTSIDLSKINTLKELWCYQTRIIKLDVTAQTDLEKLFCYSNRIKELDLSNNLKLRHLGVQNCLLKSIDLSKCPELESVLLKGNNIGTLDLTHNAKLKELDCERTGITSLDLSKCTELTFIQCSMNSLETLNVSNLSDLDVLKADITDLQSLDVSNNPKLKKLHLGGNKLTTIDLSHNPLLEELNLNMNKLTALDFLPNLPNLKMLLIKRNNFTADPDFSNNPKLEYIDIQRCGFKHVDLSNNPEIRRFYCESNELTELDLTKTPKLRDFIAFENNFTSLDFSACKELQYADISVNAIAETAMQVIVESIPKFKLLDENFLAAGRFLAIDIAEGEEKNDITDRQVKVATDKGWVLMNGNAGDPQPYLGRNTVSVTQPATAATAIYYNSADERLYVRLAKDMPATLLKVYTASGEELLSEVYDEEDSSIYIGYLPQGAYIVQVGDTTYKFVKG